MIKTRPVLTAPELRRSILIHGILSYVLPSIFLISLVPYIAFRKVNAFDLSLLFVFSSITIIGIEVGYHRYFSHLSFKPRLLVKAVLGILGSMAGEGMVIYWAASHRRHHRFSDVLGDPHSPYWDDNHKLSKLRGLIHSHFLWVFEHQITNTLHFSPDLLNDPVVTWVNRTYAIWLSLGLLIPGILGLIWYQNLSGFVVGFFWGGLARFILVQQSTFAVNSICHIYGSRRFARGGRATNNMWLCLPTFGGSWHNNHHAFPHSAYAGLRWYEIDISGYFIKILEICGWVSEVKRVQDSNLTLHKGGSYGKCVENKGGDPNVDRELPCGDKAD